MTHPDKAKPLKTLQCTACGEEFQGRQWWNQDTGYGLGPCCYDFAARGFTEASEFRETYGHTGVHIFHPE